LVLVEADIDRTEEFDVSHDLVVHNLPIDGAVLKLLRLPSLDDIEDNVIANLAVLVLELLDVTKREPEAGRGG
jgi:hypothetical protein